MRIPFMLIDNSGNPMIGQANNAHVQLSKDGAGFVDATNEVYETGSGCYYIDLSASERACTYYVNIKVTIEGGQMSLIQYTPDIDPDDIADAVWENGRRTLTSLSPDKPATLYKPSPCKYKACPPPCPSEPIKIRIK